MEHFGAVFKLDLTEETRTQLQEEEAIASCLILATPMQWSQNAKNKSILSNIPGTSGMIDNTVAFL